MGGSKKDEDRDLAKAIAAAREGEEALAAMVHTLGQEVVDKAVGVWLAKSHRERPRLFWAKPDSPARAPHYMAFVRQLNCCICGAPPPSEPHHFGPRGIGQKTDDYRTVPLCRRCHDQQHNDGPMQARIQSKMIETLVRYLRIVEQT